MKMNNTISALRKRVVGEIIPIGAENSRTFQNGKADYAIDFDFLTKSNIIPETSGSTLWLKITLDKIHGVQKVMRYDSNGTAFQNWTCNAENGCASCQGAFCGDFVLTVSAEGALLDVAPFPDCKHGDRVKFEKVGGDLQGFKIPEIAIIGLYGKFSSPKSELKNS